MLAKSPNRRRPNPASTRLSTHRTGRRTSDQKKFQSRFNSSQGSGWSTYCQYIIWGTFALALLTTIVLVTILIKNNNHPKHVHRGGVIPFDGAGNIRANALNELMQQQNPNSKMKPIQMIYNVNQNMGLKSRIPKPVANPNEVDITFRIYKNINCSESDPSQFETITKSSKNVDADSNSNGNNDCPLCYQFCNQKINENDVKNLNERGQVKSIKIISSRIGGQLDLYNDCGLNQYHSSIFEFEGCVHTYDWPNTAGIIVRRNYLDFPQELPRPIPPYKLPPLQKHLIDDGISEESKRLSKEIDNVPSYIITYSCESSEYCAFQAQANYYGYLTSSQHPKSNFIRLLTAQEPDDMAEYVPTFTAPRNAYSRRYSPYNKADVLVKWFESPQNKPEEEIIVVIDPDNWIIRDITHWVVKASEGHAVGEAAWFHGSGLVTKLWKEVCLKNCDWALDMVGVPYIVHQNDLAKIAPYFKMYIDIMKEREERDPEFLDKYKGIQMGWGTEMFGYIFGAAHAGIKHEVVHGIQRRDVSNRPRDKKEELSIDMIHMGRAWFPNTYEPGKIWWHTEGKAWSRFGAQVWCKCNYTASDIIPWPLPMKSDGVTHDVDFQSYHTLYLLHYGREYFGELPKSKYRQPSKRYHEPYP